MALKTKLGISFNKHIDETIKLFDTLVKPILLYSSDFWGCLKVPMNNPVENLHSMFCKQLLGVHKSTTNIWVLLELGRTPLMHFAQKSAIKNWSRIHNSKTNSVMRASYKGAVTDDLDWYQKITSSINEIGLGNVLDPSTSLKDNFHSVYFRRCQDIFQQNAFGTIANLVSKLRTYNLIKDSWQAEAYLKVIKNVKDRTSLSKFRLSNHKLLIETGRHENLNKEDRICPFCCTLKSRRG